MIIVLCNDDDALWSNVH